MRTAVNSRIFVIAANNRSSRKQNREVYKKYISKYEKILKFERVNVQLKHTRIIWLVG